MAGFYAFISRRGATRVRATAIVEVHVGTPMEFRQLHTRNRNQHAKYYIYTYVNSQFAMSSAAPFFVAAADASLLGRRGRTIGQSRGHTHSIQILYQS